MKMKTASIGMVLLLTVGVITVVSFSLGCTEQEESPVEPAEHSPIESSDNIPAESLDSVPAEPTENTPVEPAESTPAEPGNTPLRPVGNTPDESEEVIPPELEPISAGDITDIEWQWTGFQDSDSPENLIAVPGPEKYTLAFFADGMYYIKADCNTGSGTYTMEGNNLTLDPPVTTLVACGPESMDGEFLSLLPTVEAAALEDGQLILYPGNEWDKMFFINGGKAEH